MAFQGDVPKLYEAWKEKSKIGQTGITNKTNDNLVIEVSEIVKADKEVKTTPDSKKRKLSAAEEEPPAKKKETEEPKDEPDFGLADISDFVFPSGNYIIHKREIKVAANETYFHTSFIRGLVKVGKASFILGYPVVGIQIEKKGDDYLIIPSSIAKGKAIELVDIKKRVLGLNENPSAGTARSIIDSLQGDLEQMWMPLKNIPEEECSQKGFFTSMMVKEGMSLLGVASVAGEATRVIPAPEKENLLETIKTLSMLLDEDYDDNIISESVDDLIKAYNDIMNNYVPVRRRHGAFEKEDREKLFKILKPIEKSIEDVIKSIASIVVALPAYLQSTALHLLILQEMATIDPETWCPSESVYGISKTGSLSTLAEKYATEVEDAWIEIVDQRRDVVRVEYTKVLKNLFTFNFNEFYIYSITDQGLGDPPKSEIFIQPTTWNAGKILIELLDEFADDYKKEVVRQLKGYLADPPAIASNLRNLVEDPFLQVGNLKPTFRRMLVRNHYFYQVLGFQDE